MRCERYAHRTKFSEHSRPLLAKSKLGSGLSAVPELKARLNQNFSITALDLLICAGFASGKCGDTDMSASAQKSKSRDHRSELSWPLISISMDRLYGRNVRCLM